MFEHRGPHARRFLAGRLLPGLELGKDFSNPLGSSGVGVGQGGGAVS